MRVDGDTDAAIGRDAPSAGTVRMRRALRPEGTRAFYVAPDYSSVRLDSTERHTRIMSYDIIGDVHGHANELKALLRKLGYVDTGCAFRHPTRTAIFVGDLIDRGPRQLECVEIVRAMVAEDTAVALLGNHELNAIAWSMPDGAGGHLRTRKGELGAKNRDQHRAFLAEVGEDSPRHAEVVDWFLTLPLWLERPGLRVVHACWHPAAMAYLEPHLRPGRTLTRELMPAATREPEDEAEKDSPEMTVFKAVEALTKGLEVTLPNGVSFPDGDGLRRTRVRVRWWDEEAVTFRRAAVDADLGARLPEDLVTPEHTRMAPSRPPPVFFGHYWLRGSPTTQGSHAVCVDYSIAKGGLLTAYRFDGEATLDAGRFVVVAAGEV